MRDNLKEGLKILAGPPPQWPGLTDGINWLDDNAPSPASEHVGTVLVDDREAKLVERVHDAWEAVLRETARAGGPNAPDEVHYGASSWPKVVAAATEALKALEAADRGSQSPEA